MSGLGLVGMDTPFNLGTPRMHPIAAAGPNPKFGSQIGVNATTIYLYKYNYTKISLYTQNILIQNSIHKHNSKYIKVIYLA